MREEGMNCKAICELLTAYLDGEVTPEERAYIETHLSGCPRCRAEKEAMSATQMSLRGALKSMAEDICPSPQSWEKIKERLETKESRRGFWSAFTLGRVATAATAVAVLVVAIVIWQFGGFFGMSPQAPAPAPTSAPTITVPGTTVPPTVVPRPTPPPAPTITITPAPVTVESAQSARMIYWIVPAALVVAAFMIGRDARKRGRPWLVAIGWAAMTLLILPIGLGLYIWLGRRAPHK